MKTKKKTPKINAMTCLIAVTVLVCLTMIVKGFVLQPVINANEKKAKEIEQSIEYENQRIEEIDTMLEKVGTDEYIEKVAREKLGMIKSDEIVFVDISGQ